MVRRVYEMALQYPICGFSNCFLRLCGLRRPRVALPITQPHVWLTRPLISNQCSHAVPKARLTISGFFFRTNYDSAGRMSGLDVIGGIAAVIEIINASIKIYDSARNDIKLSGTFRVVGRRLPIILHTLQTCKSGLEPKRCTLPPDVCEALEKILDSCDENARKLRDIFEIVIPGDKDTWEKRYAKIMRRLGKGNKVDELMLALTEDVQLIVNHHAVVSAHAKQQDGLDLILHELKTLRVSCSTDKLNHDFSFKRPAGVCLGSAPRIAPGLFIGRKTEIDQMANILHLQGEPLRQKRLVLGGTGGVGKTQLALAYAESHRQAYSSVFWLNAASEPVLKESFQLIAKIVFDAGCTSLLESEETVTRVHQWLSDRENTEWLLIFDNYDDPSQFNLETYIPPPSHGAIIVTTRRPHCVSGSDVRIKPLENIDESLAVLQARSKREDTKTGMST